MRRFLVLGVLLTVLAACEASPPPATTPVPQELRMQLRSGPSVPQNVNSFKRIVNRMEPVVERECRRRASGLNCNFAIRVITDPKQPPNAFQTLTKEGQPVLAFTATLIEDVKNADELAFVLGHEAAHHIAGHLARQQQNAALGAAVFGVLASQTGGSVSDAQQLGATVGARSYSKVFELEADALGTELTYLSGYDPVVGAAYFTRIADPGNRFLGTHPPNNQRIETVLRTAARLQ
ncbi:MAG: M48 family metallopeptidase [Pseudomonadota bacterium]